MKSVKINFIWQAITEMLRVILPIATSPYLARTLGSEGVGVFAYAQSIVFTFKTCMDLGIHSAGRRSVAKVRDSQAALNECFSNILTLHFVISFIGTIAYFCYSFFFAKHETVALIMGIWVIESLFSVNWFYVGMEQVKEPAVRFLITKLISFFLIFIFVRGRYALGIYALIISSSVLLAELTLWPRLRFMVRFVKPSFQSTLSYLPGSLVLFIPTLLESVYHTMDKIMLGVMSGESQVGFYDYASKSLIVRSVLNALAAALLPRISYLFAKKDYQKMWSYIDQSLRVTIAFSVALSFGVAAVASDFAALFWGEEFSPCGNITGQ